MEFYDVLIDCRLFTGVAKEDTASMLNCLSAREEYYEKGSFILNAGEEAVSVGVVLTGQVHIIQEDYWGNRTILAGIMPGELFGEAFSCAGTDKLPVSVIAEEDSHILCIDYRKIVTTCTSACVFHARLLENMLHILAQKNIMLTQKLGHLAKRTTRMKLLSYLSGQAVENGSRAFDIPFSRQGMADYLCVERSALSAELGRLQREGILCFRKNRFELLK